MRLTITIRIVANTYDIQVNSEQRIKTTLRVMKENIQDLTHLLHLLADVEVREKHSGRRINIGQTFEEEKIYSGYELVVIPTNNASLSKRKKIGYEKEKSS